MLQQILRLGPQAQNTLGLVLRRNIAASSVAMASTQSMTPVQKLYLDKIKDYAKKSKAQGGKLVDADPVIEKEIAAESSRLNKLYGGGDLAQFPTFDFKEIDFDAVEKK
ncbi:ATP synthase-coupling factor 6, mitochondrial-like [Asterias rubens]|uniref:ATP synthase-coupling factor 6, mitochondrial-like n=1 Tax=Asterias rubens TaxID=7604 RepID=UPI001455785D|nr:ATP synthase-coupling factor 6, mitochondrial-like [Asterias rubens]XP_033641053.1 ATP synthase-coupling factor 6, mitochondrial-like [Asterias rubens]